MKAYADYKSSGVEWLGEVPSHWQAVKFGQIFAENKIKNKGMIENNLLSLSYGNIIQKNIENAKGLVPENFETYQIVNPDDIIFRFTDLQNDKKSLRSAISKHRGIITSAYVSVKLKKDGNADFFNYLFRAYDLMKVFYSMGDGMRQSLKMDELNRLILVIPNEAEQQEIAQFLDTKTAQIDALITEQNRLIELLTEQRKAVISHAVTKGLNPNAPMKNSGVEWLGEVPSGWEMKPLNSLFKRIKLTNFPQEMLLSVYRDYGVIPKDSRDDNHNVSSEDLTPYQLVDKDFLVVNKMKAWQGSLAISKYRGIVSPAYYVYKPLHHFNSDYLHNLLRSIYYIQYYKNSSKGIRVGQWDLDDYFFNRIKVLIPPLAEQNEIVAYIETQTAQIDALITEQKRLIECLKEYRTALISAAVTGKIDVQAV